MQHLVLRPGPVLVMRPWEPDPENDAPRLQELDISSRAHEYLFESITIDADTTLGDIFRLMDASPLLQQVFRQDLAAELCAEARKGPVARAAPEPPPHEGIEYLELYQQWGLDTSGNEYASTQRLHLHGVGRELAEDVPEHGRKQGERIEWSVSLTPLRELLLLPVRSSPEVQVIEDDLDAKAYGQEIARTRNADVTLGQVIHGLLWELSFHGGPQEQQEVIEELERRVAEVDAGTVELVSGDSLFERLDRPGCVTLFDDLGGRSAREIANAIRDIEDDENAATWLDKSFGGAVVVKPQFRDRNGREFRKAFRAAAR